MTILTGKRDIGSLDRKGTFDGVKNPDIAASRKFRFPSSTGYSAPPEGGIGTGPQLPPHSDPPGVAPFMRLQFPPRIEKISGSVDFRASNFTLVLPALGIVDGPSFKLPEDTVGWLQNNAIYVLTPAAATDFSMAVLINGGPVPGFDDIRIPPGVANFVLLGDDDMRIRIPNNALVSTRFTNRRAAAETVGGLIQGWYHPLAAEARVWGDEV